MKYDILHQKLLPERLNSVCLHANRIYVGGTEKKLYSFNINLEDKKIISSFKKSIRTISQFERYLACASYDSTAIVLKNHEMFDLIEGPETEIKSIAIKNHECAISTRGKQVWILTMNENIEVESILEDHTQDVKGVKYYNEHLFSYGYDNTIKIYEKAMYGDEKYELIENITDHTSTVWDVSLQDDFLLSCDHFGNILKFKINKIGVYQLEKTVKASAYPIYKLLRINNNLFCYICNRNNIVFIDSELEEKFSVLNLHSNEINSIDFSDEHNIMLTVGDDGLINVIKLFIE